MYKSNDGKKKKSKKIIFIELFKSHVNHILQRAITSMYVNPKYLVANTSTTS